MNNKAMHLNTLHGLRYSHIPCLVSTDFLLSSPLELLSLNGLMGSFFEFLPNNELYKVPHFMKRFNHGPRECKLPVTSWYISYIDVI